MPGSAGADLEGDALMWRARVRPSEVLGNIEPYSHVILV